jgi:hypothetical protein
MPAGRKLLIKSLWASLLLLMIALVAILAPDNRGEVDQSFGETRACRAKAANA